MALNSSSSCLHHWPLESQLYVTTPSLCCGRNGIQGFMHARHGLCQLIYNPRSMISILHLSFQCLRRNALLLCLFKILLHLNITYLTVLSFFLWFWVCEKCLFPMECHYVYDREWFALFSPDLYTQALILITCSQLWRNFLNPTGSSMLNHKFLNYAICKQLHLFCLHSLELFLSSLLCLGLPMWRKCG